MHRRRLDQTAFGFAFVKTCVAHVPDIVIEYTRIPQRVGGAGVCSDLVSCVRSVLHVSALQCHSGDGVVVSRTKLLTARTVHLRSIMSDE